MALRLASLRTLAPVLALVVGTSSAVKTRAQDSGPTPPPAPHAPPPAAYPPGYYPPPGAYPPPGYQAEAAEPPPRPDPPATATHLGIGYKIGNGLGLIGGDIIISPFPHIVADLQASALSYDTDTGTATGYGFAPALQLDIRAPGLSTPYIGVGYVYARLSLGDVTGAASGVFVNGGYEWKWSFGLGLLLGGGFCYLGEISATNGVSTIKQRAQLVPNLEFGVRFMFL